MVRTRKLESSISARAIRKMEREALENFTSRRAKVRQALRDETVDFFNAEFRQTNVYKALTGGFDGDESGQDLPAVYGLTNNQALNALRSIASTVVRDITVSVKPVQRRGTRNQVEIFVDGFNRENYLPKLVNEFSYISENGAVIEWMNSLLHPHTTMDQFIDELNRHLIKYGNSRHSRSGRAIMVEALRENAKGQRLTVLPRSMRPPNRHLDFIQQIVRGESGKGQRFSKRLSDLLQKRLDRSISQTRIR